MAKKKPRPVNEATQQWASINKGVKAIKQRRKSFMDTGEDISYEKAGELADNYKILSDKEYEIQREKTNKSITEHYRRLAEEKSVKVASIIELARDNLCNFRSVFLENEQETDLRPAEFHYRFSEHLINGKDNIAILGFRGCAKSEYVLRAFPLYCLAFPSSDRDFIVILKYNDDQAKQVIKSIRKEYENSDRLKHNLVRINESSSNIFEAEVRDEAGKIHRVRIMGFGKGASIRGLRDVNRRPKVIIGDDVQDKSDFIGEKIHEQDWEWFDSDVRHLGSQHSRIFMIGNNLGERCIMERIKSNRHLINFSFESIPQADGDWEPAWPARDTRESIIKDRDNALAMGSLAYSRWLMEKLCVAVNDETRIFRKEKFRYYSQEDQDKIIAKSKLYLISDLACSTKQTSDYRVLLVVAVDSNNRWYLMDCPYGQWDTKTYMEKMFELIENYKIDTVHLEDGTIFQSLEPFIRDEMSKSGIYFRIGKLKADRKKEERIAMLQPRFEAEDILFPYAAHWLPEMENELLSFTMEGAKSLHDDLIDTLAYMIKIAKAPSLEAIRRRRQPRSTRRSLNRQIKM